MDCKSKQTNKTQHTTHTSPWIAYVASLDKWYIKYKGIPLKRVLLLQSKIKKLGNVNFKMSATPSGCQRCFVTEGDEGINADFP